MKKQHKNVIWRVEYDVLPSNDTEWMIGIGDATVLGTEDSGPCIERVKAAALKETWRECKGNGDDDPRDKIVRIVGFRLTGLSVKERLMVDFV